MRDLTGGELFRLRPRSQKEEVGEEISELEPNRPRHAGRRVRVAAAACLSEMRDTFAIRT